MMKAVEATVWEHWRCDLVKKTIKFAVKENSRQIFVQFNKSYLNQGCIYYLFYIIVQIKASGSDYKIGLFLVTD